MSSVRTSLALSEFHISRIWQALGKSTPFTLSAFPADCVCAEHRICGVERRLANPPRPDPRTRAFPRYISWSSPVPGESSRLLEEENLMHLRQVSGGEFGLFHPRGDLFFEFIESAPQRAWE